MEFDLEIKDCEIVLEGPEPQMFSFERPGAKSAVWELSSFEDKRGVVGGKTFLNMLSSKNVIMYL